MYEVLLVLATIGTGLMAGLFFAYTVSVMPALRGVEDRVFVDVMQRINRAIQNAAFGLVFVGAALTGLVAAVMDVAGDGAGPWVPLGVALYIVTLVITFAINIPLNNRLDVAGRPGRIADPAGARRAFEGPWVRWNAIRTLTCVAGFACLVVALAG